MDNELARLLGESLGLLDWSPSRLAAESRQHRATVHKYLSGKRTVGDVGTIASFTKALALPLAEKLPRQQFSVWVARWTAAVALSTGYPRELVEALVGDATGATEARFDYSTPSGIRDQLQARVRAHDHAPILNELPTVIRHLHLWESKDLSRPEAFALADSYCAVAWAIREGSHPARFQSDAVPLYGRALLIVERPSSLDLDRQADILSKLALIEGMSASIPSIIGTGHARVSKVMATIREALPLTGNPWIRSELLRHQAQFQIRAAQAGDDSPLVVRRTIEEARKYLERARIHSATERWHAARLLDEIEARGILTVCSNKTDLADAEQLMKSFQEVLPSQYPVQELQYRYLGGLLLARRGEPQARSLSRRLWLAPELTDYPYQIFRVLEVSGLIERVLADRHRAL